MLFKVHILQKYYKNIFAAMEYVCTPTNTLLDHVQDGRRYVNTDTNTQSRSNQKVFDVS